MISFQGRISSPIFFVRGRWFRIRFKTTPSLITRLKYLASAMLTYLFVCIAVFFLVEEYLTPPGSYAHPLVLYTAFVIYMIPGYTFALLHLSYVVRRLHDVGKSGWYLLLPSGSVLFVILAWQFSSLFLPPATAICLLGTPLNLVRIFTLGYIYRLLLLEGQPGTNQYGPPPSPNNQQGQKV